MGNPIGLYLALGVVLVLSILIDFFGHKGKKEQTLGQSVLWSIFWIAIAVGFGGYIYLVYGAVPASEYFSGYAMEKALSIDNLMVFMAIFTFFGITDSAREHKVLLWGIAGALIFRGIFVMLGTSLFNLHWSVQVAFGVIVLYSAYVVMKGDDEHKEVNYNEKGYIRFIKRFYPVDTNSNSSSFFTVTNRVRAVTPLFLCMVTIELSDIMFSFDSVPAVIGITKEPPLVYAAMVMAILGLRALFFVLGALIKKLTRLSFFVGLILVFVGAKLIGHPFGYEVEAIHSLYVVLGLLGLGVVTSLVFPAKDQQSA